jgi:hypothetical protein
MELPFLKHIQKHTASAKKTFGVRTSPYPLFILGVAILVMSLVIMTGGVLTAFQMALFLAPVWVPFLLVDAAWTVWIVMKRSEFIAAQKYVLLEIRPPRNVVKTPLAMEAFLAGIHMGPGESTWYAKYILGKVRPWWSLEIVSLEGQVHFYIWTRAGFRRLIESQIYAQYPGAQVVEAVDYTRLLSATPEEWEIWGCDFVHTKEDPLPLKTYVEYGLDKVQKEPEQVDPLANLIEVLGSMKKGEYLWIQIVIRMHKGDHKYEGKVNAKGKQYDWKDQAEEMIQEIRDKTRDTFVDSATGEERPGFPNPTKGQMETIAAIERNISKQAFDVGIRGIYLTHPDKFDPINISGLTSIFKHFSSEGWNGLRPSGWMTYFDDYPWEIGTSKLKKVFRSGLIEAYRRRQFFHDPIVADTMVMSTEEIATLYHIPSQAVAAPSLGRIQSATAEAPTNLPV